jgi:ribosomal protein L37AE/L43A
MAKRAGACDHCGAVRKLRPARLVRQWYCPKCWDRFGGSAKRTNRAAAVRRATGR